MYTRAHDGHMGQWVAKGFVASDTLVWTTYAGAITLKGELGCRGNIVIRVSKTLEVLDGEGQDALVQTVEYSYNASVRGHGTFLRVDNAHVHPGHRDAHHLHREDWRTKAELPGSPEWIGVDGWPTLGGFIQMVDDWYWSNRSQLPEPDGEPTLGSGAR